MLFPVLISVFTLVQAQTYITAPCATDAGCASGCCGFNTGICAGPITALTRDGGCGYGDNAPNRNAAAAMGSLVQIPGYVTDNVNAKTYITAPCVQDADCTSGCCGFTSGLCAGAITALTTVGGCGHGNSTPNRDAAVAMGSVAQIADTVVDNVNAKTYITDLVCKMPTESVGEVDSAQVCARDQLLH